MSDTVHVTRNGAILEIVLDHPKANTINQPVSRRMGEVFAEFRDDPELRVAILTGAGPKFFSAGWDLNEASEVGGDGYSADYGQGGLYGFAELPGLDKPVIIAMNGYAVGAGFEIALIADFVVASDNAQMWLAESQLGLMPDVGTFLLPRILPPVIANEVLFANRRLSAAEAERWGLVNRVVPQDELMEAARELAARVIRTAPLAVAGIRQTVKESARMSLEEAYKALREDGFAAMTRCINSEDAAEGPRAMLERRDPVWKGR